MKRNVKILITAALSLCACAALSGCSKTKINLNDYLVTEFAGYDTVGTVTVGLDTITIINDNLEVFGLDEESTAADKQAVFRMMETAIGGKFDKSTELINGETITFEWDELKTEKLEEEYKVSFVCSDVEYVVDGLEEIQEVDPFEKVEVVFEGKAPNGRATLNNNSGDNALTYTLDKSDGLSNGDTVTVTVDYTYGMDDEKYIQLCGKKLLSTETTYTVEGLASYPAAIEEISADMQEKMAKQAEDTIKAHCSGWKEGNSLASLELLGNYYLSVKSGFNSTPGNRIYYVFKVTANMTGLYEEAYANGDDSIHTGTDEYYTYVYFDEIINLPDGTTSVDLSKNQICFNVCNSNYGYANFFGTSHYTFNGYKDLDTMFNDCITANIEKYDYVNTVK